MAQELNDRAKQVLAAVVANYIASAEPVGSRTISKEGAIPFSPATIRYVMADLEDMGLLEQPHVSAGRVPTPAGLRVYVDSLMQVEALDLGARARVRRALEEGLVADLTRLLQNTGRALSEISGMVAVVAAPSPEQELFRHIEFIRVNRGVILVILVSRGGVVQNRIVRMEDDILQDDLDRFARYLNDMLADLTLSEVKRRVAQEKQREKNLFDLLLNQALTIGQDVRGGGKGGEVFVEGRANLMNAPEFSDVMRLRTVFQSFEEKATLLRLLEQSTAARRVNIIIGPETEVEGWDDLTAVTSGYGGEDSGGGAVAIIGPRRMDYAKIIPTVEFTAGLLTRLLDRRDDSE